MSESVHHTHHTVSHDDSIRTLLSWNAPGRPYSKKGREFYASVFLLVLLISIILFLFHEYVLMLTVFALAFLSLALASVPPRNFHYRISTQGVKIEES